MHQDKPGRGDPIGPQDWLKVIPFQAVAASDRLGWVGLEAARYRASPAWEYNAPALTHHRLVLAPARACLGRAAGRHQRDRSGGGRHVPLHPFVPQIQLVRRAGEEEKPVVGQARAVEFKGGRRPAASRLQADPPEPVARRRGLVWE